MADLYGVWVGIGRDEAQTLPAVLSSIATASGLFRGGCAVIIYENDSADGTAELEEPWLATAPDRVRVVAVDLDLRLGFPAPATSAFAFRCADAFAVAPLAFDERAFGGLACFWAALNGDRERRPAFPPNLPPRAVDSAFGGLCCYRYAALEGLRHDDQCEDCEHVSLCRSMKRAGFEVLFNPAALLWNADYDDPRTLVGARVDAWAAYDDPAGPHLGAVHDDAATLDRDAWRRSGGGTWGFEVDGDAAARLATVVGPPSDRVRVVAGDGRRLTFGAAVAYADAVAAAGALVAVANADVALDHATCLRQAHRALCGRRHRVLALTRHETTPFGPQLFGGGARPDAQDCWLYLAPLELGRARKACDVPLGKGGADNRVAFQLLLGGVACSTRRGASSCTVQAEEKRGWRVAEVTPPYAYLPPATIEACRHAQFAPMACLDDGRSRGHATLRAGDCKCLACGRLRALLREWHRLGLVKLRSVKARASGARAAAPLATYKRAVALARLATGAPPAAGACLESE
ncbi:hypothetical protein JL721_2480 [Aureococcus anophagefferens]|nr:hypothetical protein JL721_2480 [Aureococcus anophagefferens]